MEKTLHQLGELLLTALPTVALVAFIAIYLKYVFFQPLDKVLKKRYDATEGARKLAEESLQRATAKTEEYEAKLRAARAEIYQAQEEAYKELQERAAAQVAEARAKADQALEKARQQIAADVETAKAELAQNSDALGNEIADAMLRRRVA